MCEVNRAPKKNRKEIVTWNVCQGNSASVWAKIRTVPRIPFHALAISKCIIIYRIYRQNINMAHLLKWELFSINNVCNMHIIYNVFIGHIPFRISIEKKKNPNKYIYLMIHIKIAAKMSIIFDKKWMWTTRAKWIFNMCSKFSSLSIIWGIFEMYIYCNNSFPFPCDFSLFFYFYFFCMFLALSTLPRLCCEGKGGVGGRDGIISLFTLLTLRSIELKIHFYS